MSDRFRRQANSPCRYPQDGYPQGSYTQHGDHNVCNNHSYSTAGTKISVARAAGYTTIMGAPAGSLAESSSPFRVRLSRVHESMISSLAPPAEETLRIHSAPPVTHRVDAAHPAPAALEVAAAPAPGSGQSPSPDAPSPGASSPGAVADEKLSSGGEELSSGAGSPGGVAALTTAPTAPGDPAPVDCRFDYAALRGCHVEDLLDHLQRLSEEIDARSAKLHADIATHERRERAFRLWAQQHAQEILVQQEQCRQQQAALQAQARRLAMTDGIIRA
jgi:hypothetical protein